MAKAEGNPERPKEVSLSEVKGRKLGKRREATAACPERNRGIRPWGFTITELVFVVAIISIAIILLTPFINNIRSRTKILACEENLQNINIGLKIYASEHEGKFPLNLSELVTGKYIESENVLDCPSSSHAGNSKEPDYHYTTGYTISSPSSEAIIFDKAENHKRGKHVLYISGDIVWLAD